MKETTKRLRTAKLCLGRAIKEKNEGRRASLFFQFSKQMASFCDRTAIESKTKTARNKLLSYASFFDKFAQFWRSQARPSEKTTEG